MGSRSLLNRLKDRNYYYVWAGIQSIHRGQTEAARSLGMTYVKSMRHVILPQALRRILPPLAGQFISLIKDSSLLGIIAIRELTKEKSSLCWVHPGPVKAPLSDV